MTELPRRRPVAGGRRWLRDGFAVATRRKAALLAVVLLLAWAPHPAGADQVLHLPYASGTKIQIIQGYNAVTHVGVERYSLDLVRADGGTSGAAVFAPASGSVAWAQPPGGDHGCIGVSIDGDGDFHYMLCHIILNHTYAYGDPITVGQPLGTVGAPGLVGNNGTSHVHMQLYTAPGGVRTPQPYAPPAGIPLDGVAMPTDGSFNQWACPSLACTKLVSTNPATRSASAGVAATSTISSAPLVAGSPAVVEGTGDCLRVHSQPSMSSPQLGCVSDGTAVYLKDGPSQADGHDWWDLSSLGWVVADYLQTTTVPGPATPQSADPTAVLTPPANAVSSPATPPALSAGGMASVNGTGDCLRLHAQPSMDAAVLGCISDGTAVAITDGPRSADGHDWWLLDAGGWAVSDYLHPLPGG